MLYNLYANQCHECCVAFVCCAIPEVFMNTQKMIQVLLTAIDSGSLTKAGEILGYTQSNLTQMMRSFEDEVGFPLLIKTKKGVEPTREALQLLPTLRTMRGRSLSRPDLPLM